MAESYSMLDTNSERYTMECAECGTTLVSEAASIDSGFLTFRVVCECGTVNKGIYRASGGRVHDDSVKLQFAIHEVFAAIHPPMTVRQVFYQLSNRHVVGKSESGYNKAQRALTTMRRVGTIPYSWVSDNSRTYYHTKQHDGLADALGEMQRFYRRDLWAEQNAHVEVWLEKRSLVSQLLPVCDEFGVKLYPCGGYSSISFAYEAAMELRSISKPVYVYHLSDLDADGAFSSVVLERELRRHGVNFHFERLTLTPAQVDRFGLHDALRPQKPTSKRYRWWLETYGKQQMACEMDAIDPRRLRSLVRDAITRHIDPYNWNQLQRIEAEERKTLAMLAKDWGK